MEEELERYRSRVLDQSVEYRLSTGTRDLDTSTVDLTNVHFNPPVPQLEVDLAVEVEPKRKLFFALEGENDKLRAEIGSLHAEIRKLRCDFEEMVEMKTQAERDLQLRKQDFVQVLAMTEHKHHQGNVCVVPMAPFCLDCSDLAIVELNNLALEIKTKEGRCSQEDEVRVGMRLERVHKAYEWVILACLMEPIMADITATP